MTTHLSDAVRRFLESQPVGIIATQRFNGLPRQSLVYYVLDGDRILISTVGGRGKARDVKRRRWASFCVIGHAGPYPSCSIEGPAQILTEGIGEATARVVEKIRGERPDPVPTDAGLAKLGRVILEIRIGRVYGVSYVE